MAAPLDPVYLIWGEDRPKIARAIQRLTTRIAEEGGYPERLSAGIVGGADVVELAERLSFGGKQLVVVDGVDEWTAAEAAPVVAYLEQPNPETCLALVATKTPPQSLQHAVKRTGSILTFGMGAKASRREQRQWFVDYLVDEVTRQGGSITPRIAASVIDLMGGVTDESRAWLAEALAQEAVKLVSHAGSDPIGAESVAAMTVAHPDAPAYELSDALARRDATSIYRTLANAAALGTSRSSAMALQFASARHFLGVVAAQEAGPSGAAAAVTRQTGIAGYPAQRVLEHASLLPAGVGAGALARLAQLELDTRVSTYVRLAKGRDDGERFTWELAVRDILALGRADSA